MSARMNLTTYRTSILSTVVLLAALTLDVTESLQSLQSPPQRHGPTTLHPSARSTHTSIVPTTPTTRHQHRRLPPYDECEWKRGRRRSTIALRGIDFDAVEYDDECDFFTGGLVEEGGTGSAARPSLSFCIPQPDPELRAEEVVALCMDMLKDNDDPTRDAGLEVCYNFSSDRCRAANGGTLKDFIRFSNNPTFQSLVDSLGWTTISIGSEIPGTPTRGAMKTVLVAVRPRRRSLEGDEGAGNDDHDDDDDDDAAGLGRRFLWTMQKERRPPRAGCWLVHECIAVDEAYAQTL